MAGSLPHTFHWFLQFSSFAHDPSTGLRNNFNRLALQYRWSKKEKFEQWIDCQKVVFATMYNNANINKLEKWQDLCDEVGINLIPSSITACKKALGSRNVMVNLVNLIDHRTIGIRLLDFKNYADFIDHTRKEGCTFPRKLAKKEGFIKALLRKM